MSHAFEIPEVRPTKLTRQFRSPVSKSSKDNSPPVQDYASNEVVRLVITDPVIRRSMDRCHIADEILLENAEGSEEMTCQRRALLCFSDSGWRVHNLWSGLLEFRSQNPPILDEVAQYIHANYDALSDSLT